MANERELVGPMAIGGSCPNWVFALQRASKTPNILASSGSHPGKSRQVKDARGA